MKSNIFRQRSLAAGLFKERATSSDHCQKKSSSVSQLPESSVRCQPRMQTQ